MIMDIDRVHLYILLAMALVAGELTGGVAGYLIGRGSVEKKISDKIITLRAMTAALKRRIDR